MQRPNWHSIVTPCTLWNCQFPVCESTLLSPTCRYFQQLIDAIAYCHKEGVVHRDIRMEHLLLDGSVYNPLLKLTGFGFSKSEILDSQPKSNVGTPAYVPPEVLMARDSKSYDGQAMDVWACGVVLFFMLTGESWAGYLCNLGNASESDALVCGYMHELYNL